ncbi:hypothetical protein OAF30_03055 [Flavobacteriales bacterium]|nr:hypothetical protein [Flavobacteriales bacterium]
MKHLLTAIACFFALSMSAQEVLPWNPNANNDNIIGTVDLLAMLNVYGEEYSVQTCFKGDICTFFNQEGWPLVDTHESGPDCGTIICKTWDSSDPSWHLVMIVNLTNEGYVEGDVLHLIHDFKQPTGGVTFRTFYDGSWFDVTSLVPVNYWETPTAKVIFNGEYWEELD